MDADAAITVSGYLVTLTIDNSSVYGCYEMWNSITANPLSWLVITSSTIEDGEQAVSAFAGSILTLQNNTFQNNYVGVHAFSGSPVLYGVFQWVPATGNTFTTFGDLLPPHAGELGYAGIQLTNISGFTVGTTNGSAPPRTFLTTWIMVLLLIEALLPYMAQVLKICLSGQFRHQSREYFKDMAYSQKTEVTCSPPIVLLKH
ncbi:MAG: hypothetical protein ACE5DN_04215 [Flavobacteriales bacterium]